MSRYYQSRNYNQAPASKPSYGKASYNQSSSQKYYGGRNESDEERLMRNLFSSFDDDRDGSITKAEFMKMISSLGYTISHKEIAQMVNSFDSNGDGEMDFSEFMNMVKYLRSKGYKYGKEALENKIRKAFRYVEKKITYAIILSYPIYGK